MRWGRSIREAESSAAPRDLPKFLFGRAAQIRTNRIPDFHLRGVLEQARGYCVLLVTPRADQCIDKIAERFHLCRRISKISCNHGRELTNDLVISRRLAIFVLKLRG